MASADWAELIALFSDIGNRIKALEEIALSNQGSINNIRAEVSLLSELHQRARCKFQGEHNEGTSGTER